MNRYPFWKYLIILAVLGIGVLYALPNLYAPDPAVQISGSSAALEIDKTVVSRAEKALDAAGIKYFGETFSEKNALLRLTTQEDQLIAQRRIQEALGEDYVVAVNLAETTPEWLKSLKAGPMKLGLDLAGGVHFLLEVDTPKVIEEELVSMESVLKRSIREENLRGVAVRRSPEGLSFVANTDELRTKMIAIIRDESPEFDYKKVDRDEKFIIEATLKETFVREKEDYAVNQNLTTLRNRVNEIGVSEPLVQRQGRNRIVVQLPGIQDTARAKNILGKAANLEFRLQAQPDTLAIRKEEFDFRSEEDQRGYGRTALMRASIIKGDSVTNAQVGFDPDTGQAQVNITLDGDGGKLMHRKTRDNVGNRMAVLFIEFKTRTDRSIGEDGKEIVKFTQVPNKKIISLATIQSALGKQFRITGAGSPDEAAELALLLRAGALAAPMGFVEERTIGPSLGAENIALGVKSVKLGLGLVLVFMLFYYRVFGFAANIALAVNLVLLVAVMSMFGATLTLPGIAGIVLTVGMAVDANVLIFSRIKEELKNGVPNQTAISAGFDRAFVTILDANITTFIVAIILFAIGSGPVKGFAVTLAIGILTSMFTAIMGTRAIVNLIYGNRPVKKLLI